MQSKSKSIRRKKKKSKFVQKLKQPWRVRLPTRNWLELPSDLTVNILQRIGVFDILENAQKVCTAWREICKDPSMWKVIHMARSLVHSRTICQDVCKFAVDRSQGHLVDITIIGFCSPQLLQYVADRSSQLRRLEIVCPAVEISGVLSEALKKLSLLEELSFVKTNISEEAVAAAGCYCPSLKTLKVNQGAVRLFDVDDGSVSVQNETALAIGKNLPGLTHLELIGNNMNNIGLQAILGGCCHLQSLDLRGCLNLDLNGYLGKRSSQQIKHLKLPHDTLEGYPHSYVVLDDSESGSDSYSNSDSQSLSESESDEDEDEDESDDDENENDEERPAAYGQWTSYERASWDRATQEYTEARQWRQNEAEHARQWRQDEAEHARQWRQDEAEHARQWRQRQEEFYQRFIYERQKDYYYHFVHSEQIRHYMDYKAGLTYKEDYTPVDYSTLPRNDPSLPMPRYPQMHPPDWWPGQRTPLNQAKDQAI